MKTALALCAALGLSVSTAAACPFAKNISASLDTELTVASIDTKMTPVPVDRTVTANTEVDEDVTEKAE